MGCFIRYQSPVRNHRDHHLGIFALAQGLARRDELTPDQRSYRLAAHAWFNDAYPTPPAEIFDRKLNPLALCWFKSSASHLFVPIREYVATLLEPHHVEWERVMTDDPGRTLYEDDVQVVAERRLGI